MRRTDAVMSLCHRGIEAEFGAHGEHPWDVELEEPTAPQGPPTATATQAAELLRALQERLVEAWGRVGRIDALEKQTLLLNGRVARLERGGAVTVPIQSLAPAPWEVLKPVMVVVRAMGDEYVASFFDANLSASGDTPEEAVANLKDIIAAVYEILADHDEKQLGPGPSRQLHTLREFISARA